MAKDLKTAREWLEKAAAQSEPGALYNLGNLYAGGEGVPQDHKTAFSFFLRAAIAGAMDAELNLLAA